MEKDVGSDPATVGPPSRLFQMGLWTALVVGALSWFAFAAGLLVDMNIPWLASGGPSDLSDPALWLVLGVALTAWLGALYIGFRHRSRWTFALLLLAGGLPPVQPLLMTVGFGLVASREVLQAWSHQRLVVEPEP